MLGLQGEGVYYGVHWWGEVGSLSETKEAGKGFSNPEAYGF